MLIHHAIVEIDVSVQFQLSIVVRYRISCSNNRTQQVKIRICEFVNRIYLLLTLPKNVQGN